MRPQRWFIKFLLMGAVMACSSRTASAEDLLVALRLNGQAVSDGEIVSVDGDKIQIPLTLTHELRLSVPPTLIASTGASISLDQLPGVKTRLDRQALMLDIDADPEAFETMIIQNYVPAHPADTPDNPGMFLNYNLLAQDTGTMNLASGLFSLGAFSDLGVAISDVAVSTDQTSRRLRNYLTRDLGDNDGSLVVGDSFLPTGAIGEQFPFGGIQISSRTSANSDVRQIPVETMMGQAAIPSSVDVYINDALQSHQVVPAGPFVLENIPVATGDGNIRVVVRDALGQERVLVKSFYTSPNILPQGVSEYSYEAGMLRQNYGVDSFDYNEPFTSATHRYGWTKWLTTEFHGEASTQRQVLGEQSSFLVAPYGMIRIGGAASNNQNGTPGFLGLLGAETDTHPVSVGFSSETSTTHFTQLGYPGDRTLKQSSQARVTYDLNEWGSVSASLIHLNLIGQPVSNTAALSYGVNMPKIGFLGVSAFETLGNGATGAAVNFSMPLGDTATASAQVTHDQNGWGQSGQVVQNVPNGGGFGYRGQADHSASMEHAEAGVTYRANYSEVSADAGVMNQQPIGRLGASGSLGFLHGETFATHATDGNFAVVDTNGIGGIHVYADQQPAGVTDSDGKLIIPHLRPNEVNRISIDPADIPFDVAVPQSEKEVVPRSQTGYVVDFPLKHTHTAMASLVLEDGSFVPAGSLAHNAQTGSNFVVGHDGLIYLTALTGDDHFDVALPHKACIIEVVLPASETVQPDLGKLTCHS